MLSGLARRAVEQIEKAPLFYKEHVEAAPRAPEERVLGVALATLRPADWHAPRGDLPPRPPPVPGVLSHDHCCHSWKNATRISSNDCADYRSDDPGGLRCAGGADGGLVAHEQRSILEVHCGPALPVSVSVVQRLSLWPSAESLTHTSRKQAVHSPSPAGLLTLQLTLRGHGKTIPPG